MLSLAYREDSEDKDMDRVFFMQGETDTAGPNHTPAQSQPDVQGGRVEDGCLDGGQTMPETRPAQHGKQTPNEDCTDEIDGLMVVVTSKSLM
jgi:hypothetical protein